MMSRYVVANFKAIGDPTAFELRPITLIFGPNSAGKSSLLHSFLLLKHIVEGGSPDVHRTTAGGDVVDLGGRHQYAYQGRVDQPTSWRFRTHVLEGHQSPVSFFVEGGLEAEVYVQGARIPYATLKDPSSQNDVVADQLYQGVRLADDSGEILDYVNGKLTLHLHPITASLARDIKKAMTNGADLEPVVSDDKDLLAILGYLVAQRLPDPFDDALNEPKRGTQSFVKALLTAHFVSGVVRDALRAAYEFQVVSLGESLSALDEAIEAMLNFELDEVDDDEGQYDEDWATDREDDIDTDDPYGLASGRDDPRLDLREGIVIANDLGFALGVRTVDPPLTRIVETVQNLIRQALDPARHLTYLGPLRSLPATEGVRDTGDETLDALGTADWRSIVHDSALRRRINAWLGPGRLGSNLQIRVKRLFREDVLRGVIERLRVSRIGDVDRLLESLPPESVAVVLYDKLRRREVNIRNVGVGISQVLPVLVRALGPSAPDSLHMIEQPELHLHPALQAELADVFIEGGRTAYATDFYPGHNRSKGFLIETHSEHLILRLLRRIRETTEDRVPAGLELRREDVAVYYAQATEVGTQFLRMEISEIGDFQTAWPHGFFPERLRELL